MKASDFLQELELQTVFPSHVGAEKLTRVLQEQPAVLAAEPSL